MKSWPWTVVLIGGGSCTGKSSLSRALAREFDLVPVDADLYWLALQRVIPASVAPDLHAFLSDSNVWTLGTEDLVDLYLRVAESVCRALAFPVAHYDSRDIPAAIEGSWLLPSFAADVDSYLQEGDARPLKRTVKSFFLYEPSFDELDRRLHERGGEMYQSQPEAVHIAQSKMQHAYGVELKRQAESFGIPVLESRPFKTLLDRAVSVLRD